jgi:serine/threonine-protein kinase HipA
MSASQTIHVVADWIGLGGPVRVGELNVHAARGKETFSFAYDSSWLRRKSAVVIDPDLQLFSGPQYVSAGRSMFGVFMDSAPDRWGRTIMQQRASYLARQQGVEPGRMLDSDFLLGVHDAGRFGGLRFQLSPDGPFLDDNDAYAAPPLTSLRKLQEVSLSYERDDADEHELARLLQLLAPGSSLGGARPKASVIDPDGNLWIAKFPSRSDSWNVAAWEYLVTKLAERCGINAPTVQLERFGTGHSTLLSMRFDRAGNGGRIHAASAMTLLGRQDGDDHTTGVSYLDLADFIIRHCSNVSQQLEELWKRILLNVLIANTDDHLRNHSFLLGPDGTWQLAPVYDINPVPFGAGLRLNISETDNQLDRALVEAVAPSFRVSSIRAKELIAHMTSIVSTWSDEAKKIGIPRQEILQMHQAFRF